MREIEVSRDMTAGRPEIWSVLADFPNISAWNGGVKASRATSEATGGVGATRHCDLAPMGALEETVQEWVPEERMVISIDESKRLPIKSGLVTITLGDGTASSPTTLHYAYQPGLGPLGAVIGPLLDKQLSKGFTGFLEDLDKAAMG